MSHWEILFFPYSRQTIVKLSEASIKIKNVIGKAAATDKKANSVF